VTKQEFVRAGVRPKSIGCRGGITRIEVAKWRQETSSPGTRFVGGRAGNFYGRQAADLEPQL